MTIYLKDLRHEREKSERICDWKYIEVPNYRVRVYYKEDAEKGLGFLFYAVENTGYTIVPETENNIWHPTYASVQCLYNGIAYFDGIRHLYMGDELTNNYGYHYYADLDMNIATLKVIRELEIKFCRDYEK
ncbi:MAG TPA: hypothetical protein VD794_05465 [Flavisolibacter sp.]|nr:hypothetical protein [Flavisolibacter sp.]